MQGLFTAEEVADLLGLHVRTVRNYIRDGRLAATRIGKQYRIRRADLEAFTGEPVASAPPEAAARARHVEASSVIDVDAIDPATVIRVSTLLSSATAHRREGDQPVRIQTIYDEQRAHLKIIVVGGLTTSANVLELISAVVEEDER